MLVFMCGTAAYPLLPTLRTDRLVSALKLLQVWADVGHGLLWPLSFLEGGVHRASWHSPLEEKDEVRCMLCFVFEYTLV